MQRIEILLALLAEESTQLRFRSQAEHLYTAACLGAFGAFAWGVAALKNDDFATRPPLMRPAVLAAFAIAASAIFVIARILAEHSRYRIEKRNQARRVGRNAANGSRSVAENKRWMGRARVRFRGFYSGYGGHRVLHFTRVSVVTRSGQMAKKMKVARLLEGMKPIRCLKILWVL